MDNLAVPYRVVLALKKANIYTLESILEYSQSDLVRRTGLNPSQVKRLIEITSEAFLNDTSLTSCLKRYEESSKVPNWGRLGTGCPVIDGFLQGGILPEAVTELAGTSGAGKTQFCLQLSLLVQLPPEQGGLQGRAVYISTEGALPSGRLKQLSLAIANKYTPADSGRRVFANQLMDNVLLYHCADVPSLETILRHKLPTLLNQTRGIRLVLIDSIAALFRSEYTLSETAARLYDLKTIALLLHQLVYSQQVCVVCTNQMTTDLSTDTVKPALGLVWSNSVNVRFLLLRDETVDNREVFTGAGVVKLTQRTFRVEFAPHLPVKEFQYYIDNDGIHGLQ